MVDETNLQAVQVFLHMQQIEKASITELKGSPCLFFRFPDESVLLLSLQPDGIEFEVRVRQEQPGATH